MDGEIFLKRKWREKRGRNSIRRVMRGRRLTRATSRSRKSNKVKDRSGGEVETRTDVSKGGEAARGLNLNRRQGPAVLKLRFSCRRRVLIFPRARNLARSRDPWKHLFKRRRVQANTRTKCRWGAQLDVWRILQTVHGIKFIFRKGEYACQVIIEIYYW